MQATPAFLSTAPVPGRDPEPTPTKRCAVCGRPGTLKEHVEASHRPSREQELAHERFEAALLSKLVLSGVHEADAAEAVNLISGLVGVLVAGIRISKEVRS